jgi:hypothetical protein
MHPVRFDTLVRTFDLDTSRRAALGTLGGGLASVLIRCGRDNPAAGRRRTKKPKHNAFGCVNVGKACNGKNGLCCSGLCQGKKPGKGKKDKSTCVAHNVLGCQPAQDGCLEIGSSCGSSGICYRTTGQASFCGVDGAGACVDCGKDADCERLGFGSGAACVTCTSCNVSATACFPPAA